MHASAGVAYQRQQSAMGAPESPDDVYARLQSEFNTIPAFYTVTIALAGDVGATQAGSVPLRPEPFLCARITWATSGDTPAFLGDASVGTAGSAQGRSVEVTWGDEFTQFLGNRPCLLSALFADSQGFLDFPRPLLFQGKQSLTVQLSRVLWPSGSDPDTVRFDFCFQGLSILPAGINQSGSAG